MKRYLTTIAVIALCYTLYSQPQLYLGVRAGAGGLGTYDHIPNVLTTDGFQNGSRASGGWAANLKGEALFGFGRFRIGYQFLYNNSSPSRTFSTHTPIIDRDRYTMYYNNYKDHIFGHYLLMQLAIINSKHFGLVPGIALGSFNGFKVDNDTYDRVRLAEVTRNRFSFGAELNAEIKFGRAIIFLGPNYYLFAMRDNINSNWREYRHFIGGDLGFRFNLLPGAKK